MTLFDFTGGLQIGHEGGKEDVAEFSNLPGVTVGGGSGEGINVNGSTPRSDIKQALPLNKVNFGAVQTGLHTV